MMVGASSVGLEKELIEERERAFKMIESRSGTIMIVESQIAALIDEDVVVLADGLNAHYFDSGWSASQRFTTAGAGHAVDSNSPSLACIRAQHV
jgi:hypothetical protein